MSLERWETAARVEERGTVPHTRTTAAASTPAARLQELHAQLNYTRVCLQEACAEVKTLRARDAHFHTFQRVSFAGVPMAQFWCDLTLWEAVLNDNPQLRGIVELGTFQGGFSLWLSAQAEARGIMFRTYDSVRPDRKIPGFVKIDVFAEHEDIGMHLRRYEPVALFCDNGNKPRELAVFSRHLRNPGSLFLIHDWGSESGPGDVPETLEMLYQDYCEQLGSITRVFRLKQEE